MRHGDVTLFESKAIAHYVDNLLPGPEFFPEDALQAYLGHKNIMHTVRDTEMAADRFKNFWED